MDDIIFTESVLRNTISIPPKVWFRVVKQYIYSLMEDLRMDMGKGGL